MRFTEEEVTRFEVHGTADEVDEIRAFLRSAEAPVATDTEHKYTWRKAPLDGPADEAWWAGGFRDEHDAHRFYTWLKSKSGTCPRT